MSGNCFEYNISTEKHYLLYKLWEPIIINWYCFSELLLMMRIRVAKSIKRTEKYLEVFAAMFQYAFSDSITKKLQIQKLWVNNLITFDEKETRN